MERLFNQLGNMVTAICGLSCACIVVLVFGGGFLLRTAGVGLFSLLGDLIVGRVDRTPTTRAALPRPTTGASLRTRAQSLDFDTAVRQQGGSPAPMTIQAQSAAFPTQPQAPGFPGQAPAGYANTNAGYNAQPGYNAQAAGYGPTLQNMPSLTTPGLPSAGSIQPLQDNRLMTPQEMRAQAAPLPNQPYAAPYQPLGGAPVVPSLSGQAPMTPGYQPLSGGYQQQAAPVDPNAFFPAPTGGIPRRASLSAPRDISTDTAGMDDFNAENYPGLRNRRGSSAGRRGAAQDVHDSMAGSDGGQREGGLGGVINDLGNILGL
jgi:hypothetical protein